MKSATRIVATIAAGGVVAGGAVALWQVPTPKTAKTAAVTSTGSGSDQTVQSLVDQSAQLHAAIDSARAQLARLNAPSDTAVSDKALVQKQAKELTETKAALAAAEKQLAADEALLARLRPGSVKAPARGSSTTPRAVARTPPPVAVGAHIFTATPVVATTPNQIFVGRLAIAYAIALEHAQPTTDLQRHLHPVTELDPNLDGAQ
jgi:hypothetical protein